MLRDDGITDFEQYAYDPSQELQVDIFVDGIG
jgi:hypothetical protein